MRLAQIPKKKEILTVTFIYEIFPIFIVFFWCPENETTYNKLYYKQYSIIFNDL